MICRRAEVGKIHFSCESEGRVHGKTSCKGWVGIALEEKWGDGIPGREMVYY